MPLVVLCGIPQSGKSRRVRDLVEYINANYPETQVEVISFESLAIHRADGYKGMW